MKIRDRHLKYAPRELFVDGMLLKILHNLKELNQLLEIAINELMEFAYKKPPT